MAAIALLLAAGRGERLGSDGPKALVQLAGQPMLQWSLDVLAAVPDIGQIAIALPSSHVMDSDQLPAGAMCVAGGPVRSESVRLALAAAGAGDPVLIHDAARPLLTAELTVRTLRSLEAHDVDCAIAAAPVTDTIKRASGEPPIVSDTLDRSGLWAVQTPQVFRRAALEKALDVPRELLAAATDDAWLIERSGGRVAIVPSDPANLKITTPTDLTLAELLLGRCAD